MKKKSNRTIPALLAAAVMTLGTGCADRALNIGSQVSETERSTVSVDLSDMQAFETEQTIEEASSEDVSVGDVHLFERSDKVSTMFYDWELDAVTISDTVDAIAAENEMPSAGGIQSVDNREFMVLDITLTARGDETVISMYGREFLLVCFVEDPLQAGAATDYEKLYPLEEKLVEGQLDEMWLATVGEEIKGKLIYNIPKDAARIAFLTYDSYTTGDLNETVFGDGYMMTIPKENWTRETE